MTTVWGVTGYDIGGNSGYVVYALFTTEVEAARYAAENPEYNVEEFTLYETAPQPYSYWTRIAHVYPDGEVETFGEREHRAQPPGEFHTVEGHAFDGHAQGHCGWHVYASGRDRQAVAAEFAWLLEQCAEHISGTCQCGLTSDYLRDFSDWRRSPAVASGRTFLSEISRTRHADA